MWRRKGGGSFGALVLLLLAAEALVLAALTRALALRLSGALPEGEVLATLTGTVAVSGALLLLLVLWVLGYHVASQAAQRGDAESLRLWTDRWARVVLGMEEEPAGPCSRPAREALLAVGEVMYGEEGDRIRWLLESTGVGASLLRELSSRRLSVRLEALEGLARARLPTAIEPLLSALRDPAPAARLLAARALARTLAVLPGEDSRRAWPEELAAGLRRSELSKGIVDEVLLLLEHRAPLLARELLCQPPVPAPLRRAAIDAAGRLGLLELVPLVASALPDRDPEVRAAALRAAGRMGYLPEETQALVLRASSDPVDFVRVQAVRALALQPGAAALESITRGLSDPSWYVRKAAAETLALRGPEGEARLRAVAAEHPDRFAREMAAQVLGDFRARTPLSPSAEGAA